MKQIIFILILGCISHCNYAQNTTVKFGRYGACSSGRGICGIQTNTSAKTQNNADFIWYNKQLILRIYLNQITDTQQQRFIEIKPPGTQGVFRPEAAINLDSNTVNYIQQISGLNMSGISIKSYSVSYTNTSIDIIINTQNP